MKEIGNTIYLWGCVVAATIFGVGVADLWFGYGRLAVFASWVALAAVPWIIGRALLYGLSHIRSEDKAPVQYRSRAGE
jgi:hypothetical protein